MAIVEDAPSVLPVDAPTVELQIAHNSDGSPEMLAKLPDGELAHVTQWTDLDLHWHLNRRYGFTLHGHVVRADM